MPGGGDRGFCCHQKTALTARVGSWEMAGRSAASAEVSASAFLIDALLFSLFLGCRQGHGGQADVGRITGDVGSR